jgi:hypothetical protein
MARVFGTYTIKFRSRNGALNADDLVGLIAGIESVYRVLAVVEIFKRNPFRRGRLRAVPKRWHLRVLELSYRGTGELTVQGLDGPLRETFKTVRAGRDKGDFPFVVAKR